jgi:hypothetical protein
MKHLIIDNVVDRVEAAKSDSDFTYFFSLLLLGEAMCKTTALGLLASLSDDPDRNRYRLEHQVVRADGIGEWSQALEDALIGPASQFLLKDARTEQTELTKNCRQGDWQYESVTELKGALDELKIDSEEVPAKSDMKRWFRLFATLRNKTRGHGATLPSKTRSAATYLDRSIALFYANHSLFKRPWAYLYRNLSGKYRVSPIAGDTQAFDELKRGTHFPLQNGIYVAISGPRLVHLIESDADLQDFYFANGGFSSKTYEGLSYATDNKRDGDATVYHTPPGTLPRSKTEGLGELIQQGNAFSNAPKLATDYVPRLELEADLQKLLLENRRPIVTLVGRGGIGKTSVALRVVMEVCSRARYDVVVWFSARDVDLQLSGPKAVRPHVLSPEDVSAYYAMLVLNDGKRREKNFSARAFFEQQLQKNELGACLYVFDNFETSQNPVELFNWVDTYVREPNKVLITTRLRDFKGDYPVEVHGMTEEESRELIAKTAGYLEITSLITPDYTEKLIAESEGHPYVIKILLGEVAHEGRAGHIPRLVAKRDEILTALFERTYAALTPCAQRAFLTLAAWNSPIPRVALEAVLQRSTHERTEVQDGIDSLLQFSMAQAESATADKQDFISLPLVASIFGKKKLNVSPAKVTIQTDVEILQMLGPTRREDLHFGLQRRVENFLSNIARRVEKGDSFENFAPMVDMICRHYNPGWLILARWYAESNTAVGFDKAKEALRHFLENEPTGELAAGAWRSLAFYCYKTGDVLGEIHAFIERSQISSVPFYDLSNTANRLNQLLREHVLDVDREEKRIFAQRIFDALDCRRHEANSDDYSRMAWLAFHLKHEAKAREYAAAGLKLDPDNYHCQKLAEKLGL